MNLTPNQRTGLLQHFISVTWGEAKTLRVELISFEVAHALESLCNLKLIRLEFFLVWLKVIKQIHCKLLSITLKKNHQIL